MKPEKRYAIIAAYEKCRNISKVAQQLQINRKSVKLWIQRHQRTGGVSQLKRTGRTPLLSASAGTVALGLLLSSEHGTASKAAHALQAQGIVPKLVHKTTLIRHAKAAAKLRGHPIRVVRTPPAKQLGDATRQKRHIFAKKKRKMSWSSVMFTDRKRFYFYYPGVSVHATQWVEKGMERQAPKVNHAQVVNVYAGITKYGVTSCHVVAGTSQHKSPFMNKKGCMAKSITAAEYRCVLQETFLPEGAAIFSSHGIGSWFLQQDNDPTHKSVASKVVDEYNAMHGSSIQLVADWPPSSPDMSPIENVWGYVQARVNARGCKTFQGFKQAVHDEFKSIPTTMLVSLYRSMVGRMEKCVELEGNKIHY